MTRIGRSPSCRVRRCCASPFPARTKTIQRWFGPLTKIHADLFWREAGSLTVGDCLPNPVAKPATVPPEATLLEIATVMAKKHSPLIAVVDKTGD